MKYSFCVLTAAIVFFTRETLSQTLPVYELEPITSTVNRTVSFGDDTGTFEVITHEMIKQGNYKNVSEVLRTIPGIYYVSESILGNRSTESNTGPKIRIRGKGAKLLIDGRPMNMAIYGCLTNNMLTLDHVERIEVTRGSESVLYGSDGLGGVINIITREPGGLGGEFQMRGGSYDTVISSFNHENTIGPFGYFISGSLKRSDGYRGNSEYADENGYTKMNYRINDSMKIESSLNIYNGNWNDPGTLYNPQADFWGNFKRRHSDISLKGNSKTASYTIKAFHNEGHHIFTDQDGWQSRDYTNGFKADMVKDFTGGKNRLIFGADGRWLGGKALVDDATYTGSGFNFWLNNKKWYRENETALFASDKHILFNGKLLLIGGGRVVRNSGFGTFFCPKLGVTINSAKSKVHFGYNRAFRSPPLLQTNLHKKSNPDLNPEVADHFEIGEEYFISESLTVGATVFYIDGSDKSEMVFANGFPVQFENIGEWKHKGGELTARLKLTNRIAVDTGYTYLDVDSNTQYNPKHQVNFSVRSGWSLLGRDLSLNLNGLGISNIYASNNSEDRLDDYLALDFYADWHVYRYGSIVLGAHNLLDRKYQSVYGYPDPGLVLTGGIRLEK